MSVTWQSFDNESPFGVSIPDKATRTGGRHRGPPFHFTVNKGVYVLLLSDDKYYVGYSTDLERRMGEHFTGNGSLWTQQYTPIRIESIYQWDEEESRRDILKVEERKTANLMRIHGVENVRGGPWAHPDIAVCPELPPHIDVPS